jgi:hypothetical protein
MLGDGMKNIEKGLQAFEALREWFRDQKEPSVECLTTLIELGLVDREGLTLVGKQMLTRILTPEVPPSGVHVYEPGEHGIYHELDLAKFLDLDRHSAPTLKEFHQFEEVVSQRMIRSYSA